MGYKATIGSISHGTLRNQDLLETFSDELDCLATSIGSATEQYNSINALTEEARAVLTLDRAGWSDLVDSENASELVNALQDALNEFAPPYCYFGNTDGDGSDFGFWPSMEAIEELDKFNDLADVPEDHNDDFAIVNDHGNVTLYAHTDDGIKEIWAIV